MRIGPFSFTLFPFSLKRIQPEKRGIMDVSQTLWKSPYGYTNQSKVASNPTNALAIDAYWRCVNMLGDLIARMPKEVYKRTGERSKAPAPKHAVYNLLRYSPNAYQTQFDFWKQIVSWYFIRGEAFVWIERNPITNRPIALHPVDNSLVWVRWDAVNFILRYQYRGVLYEPCEFLHFKWFSYNGVTGEDPLKIHSETIGKAYAEILYGGTAYANNTKLSGVIKFPQLLTAEQKQRIQETYNNKYGGYEKVGQTLILDNNAEYMDLGATNNAGLGPSYSSDRTQTTREIGNIFGIPSVLLNDFDGVSVNNLEQLKLMLHTYTLSPLAEKLQDELDNKLINIQNIGMHFVEFDQTSMTRGDLKTRTDYYAGMRQVLAMTPNEIRYAEGLNPVEGGDDIKQPLASNIREDQPISKEEEEDDTTEDNNPGSSDNTDDQPEGRNGTIPDGTGVRYSLS